MANHYLIDRRTTASVESGTGHVNPKWENKAVTASSYNTVSKTAISEATKSTTTYTNANERTMRLVLWDDSYTDTNSFEFANTIVVGFAKVAGGCTAAVAKETAIQEYITLTKVSNTEYSYNYFVDSETIDGASFIFILDDTVQEMNTKSASTTATIVRNLSDNIYVTTIDRNGDTVTDTIDVSVSPLEVTFRTATNYRIRTAVVTYTHSGEQINTEFDNEHKSGNIPFDADTTITITGVAEYVEPTQNPINISTSNSEYSITDKNGENITTWTNETFPITFTAKANEGYYFEVAPRIAYFDEYNNPQTANLTLDETTGVYSYVLTNATGSFISFYANAAAQTVIKNKYGLVTVYNPTLEQLKQIANARYFYETDTYSTRYYKDLGDYIASLHVVYTTFNDLRTQRIYLANYPVGTDLVGVIDDNTIILNCGNIEIEGKYNNVVDYNAVIKIYLPFIGYKDLETVVYMDKEINLTYKLDVITGKAKAILTVNNIIVDTFDCEMSYNIPFVKLNSVDGDFTLNANYLYGFTAFVTVSYPNVTGDNTTYGNSDNKAALISTFNGYTAFDELTLTTAATETENKEIESILKQGVIL